MRFSATKLALVVALALLPLHSASAIISLSEVMLADYTTDFDAYDYNTAGYWDATLGYVGCGPTTGAMILNYFENHYGAAGIMQAGGGLATAWALHGSAYMQTGTNGFGSVYRIEPGLQDYATDNGHEVDVMIHVHPSYTPPDPGGWDLYGAYGDAWTNDGSYWGTDGTNWWIDDMEFYNYYSARMTAGIPVFLTVDSDGNGDGDHWVPMVGVSNDGRYAYYNTWDNALHWADIDYIGEAGAGTFAISLARTVEYVGAIPGGGDDPIPEPATLVLFGSGLLGLARFTRRFRK